MKEMYEEKRIIFFDGICSLCNNFVDLIMKLDKKNLFKLSSIQGETAKKILPENYRKNINTIVYKKNKKYFVKSTAIFEITKDLSFPISLISIFRFIPRNFCDSFYDWVSKNRYFLFGKKKSCRIPTEQERNKILP